MLSFSFLFLLALYYLVRCGFCVVLFSSGSDLKEEIIHDLDTALPKLEEWKAHILRAAHQDSAKRDVIDKLSTRQVLLIMDWAMKFLPASFRETQRDWFGKKGKSWHVTVAVTRSECNDIEVITDFKEEFCYNLENAFSKRRFRNCALILFCGRGSNTFPPLQSTNSIKAQ